MITEIAQIDVKPGTEKDFEAAVAKARPLFLRAKGVKGFELHKSIEKPQRYRLMAKWETLENHTVDFRGSEDFTAWRGLVGQYFAAPPEVEHTETVLTTARLTPVQPPSAIGRRVIRLEMVDHDLGDRHQRQRQRQAPDAEHDAEQDLEREQRRRRDVERLALDDRRQHVAFQRVHAEEQDEGAQAPRPIPRRGSPAPRSGRRGSRRRSG